jgi:proteasome lid subunit RPN8/RPN11
MSCPDNQQKDTDYTMRVELGRALQEQIFQQLETGYPNEAGGFLFGHANGDTVQIVDVIGAKNIFEAEEQFHRIMLSPLDWARLEDEADARGLTLVGYFHSHPDSPAIPSVYDRDHALPRFTYIITQVQAGKAVDMRVWLLKEDRTAFDAGELVIGG